MSNPSCITPFLPEDFVFGGGQGMRSRWWLAGQGEVSNHTHIGVVLRAFDRRDRPKRDLRNSLFPA